MTTNVKGDALALVVSSLSVHWNTEGNFETGCFKVLKFIINKYIRHLPVMTFIGQQSCVSGLISRPTTYMYIYVYTCTYAVGVFSNCVFLVSVYPG